MKKIAAQANKEAKNLATKGKLGSLKPEHVDVMEQRKAAFLVDYTINVVKEAKLDIEEEKLINIVKTANACIPATATLLPMDKFASLCDKVLEGAAKEMTKTAEMGEVKPNNPNGDMMSYRTPVEEDVNAGMDPIAQSLMNGAPSAGLSEEQAEDYLNELYAEIMGKGTGASNQDMSMMTAQNSMVYGGPDIAFAPGLAGDPSATGADFGFTNLASLNGDAFSRVAELKYMDTMDRINKVAELLEGMVKTANEAAPAKEVTDKVEDEDSPSAAKPAAEKLAKGEKKEEMNSTTVNKAINLDAHAAAASAAPTLKPDAANAPKPEVGNINTTDGVAKQTPAKEESTTKAASLDLDSLVDRCRAIFK